MSGDWKGSLVIVGAVTLVILSVIWSTYLYNVQWQVNRCEITSSMTRCLGPESSK